MKFHIGTLGPLVAVGQDPHGSVRLAAATQPFRRKAREPSTTNAPSRAPRVLATTSAYDAVRSGSSRPWVSSTRPAPTNAHAVQSCHRVRGQTREPRAETGATI